MEKSDIIVKLHCGDIKKTGCYREVADDES